MVELCKRLGIKDCIIYQDLKADLPIEVIERKINNSRYLNSRYFEDEFKNSKAGTLALEICEGRKDYYKINVEGWHSNGGKRFFDEMPFMYLGEFERDEMLLRGQLIGDEYIKDFSEGFGAFKFIPKHDANLSAYFIEPYQLLLKISARGNIKKIEDYTLEGFWNREILMRIFNFTKDTDKREIREDIISLIKDTRSLIEIGMHDRWIEENKNTEKGLKGIDNLLSIISLS